MIDRCKFIRDFVELGCMLDGYLRKKDHLPALDKAIQQSIQSNYWFTEYHIHQALRAITDHYLNRKKLRTWLSNYPDVWHDDSKEVGIVMAGNIPLVGYHDYLCVLASGRRAAVKLSSKDSFLLPALHEVLCTFAPEWRARVRFVPQLPKDIYGLIATGSDPTAAWFTEHYAHLPKIVRGHRVSVAIVHKEITQEQITGLHRDLFCYFGLGCRSVVKLFIPAGFDLMRLTACAQLPQEASHTGFRNAYRQQKALLTLQQHSFTDGGFFILQQADSLFPPLATLFYTYYTHINEAINYIAEHDSQIQCVVAADVGIKKCITFGSAQNPQLWEYADQKDTVKL